MEKLYDRIDWVNDSTPALNQSNLNAMSKAIDDIDDRVIDLAGSIMEDIPEIIEDLDEVRALIEQADDLKEDVLGYKNEAYRYSQDSLESSETSESWAVGTKNGEPVPSTDPAYHNNAKYWAENTGWTISDDQWSAIVSILS